MGPRGPEGPSCTWLADVEVSGEVVGAKGGEPEAGGGGQGGKGKEGKSGGGGGAEEGAKEEPGRKDARTWCRQWTEAERAGGEEEDML